MSDWTEVNDLSSYFKKLQEDTQVNRLSDNNCIEILEKLIKTNKVTLLYTTDGKEFVTPKYLLKEIKEELVSSGGRINIVDLATILRVDLSHIQNAVNDLIKQDSSLIFILGQLINKNYENIILDEINLKLTNYGILALNDLARSYDLPGDYITNILKKGLSSKKIAGILDDEGKRLYTEKYVENQRAKTRGIFSALVSPVNLGQTVTEHKLNENLITSLLEQLIKDNQISGVIVGNKRDKLSFMKYIPHIYTQLQKIWTINFLTQNKYLAYDSLRKINISEPKGYLSKIWSSPDSEPLAFLQTCCIELSLKNELISAIDSNLTSQGYVDVMDVVPSYMSPEDGAELFETYVKDHRGPQPYKCVDDQTFLWDDPPGSGGTTVKANANSDKNVLLLVLDATFALTRKLINDCRDLFDPMIKEAAKEASQKGYPQILFAEEFEKREKMGKHDNRSEVGANDDGPSNKRDDRRKKALTSGAKGGGAQGRETKTKALTPAHKKAGFGANKKANNAKSSSGNQNDPDGNDTMIDPLPIHEIISVLDHKMGLDEFSVGDEWRREKVLAEIADIIHRPLQQMYVEECKRMYMTSLSCKRNENKQEFEKTQETINALHQRLLLFQKGLSIFKDEKVKEDLTKYLMRTLGVELFGLIVNLQHMQNQDDTRNAVNAQTLATQDGRKTAISKFQETLKSYMTNLNNLLSHNEITEFLGEITSGSQTGIINVLIKKYDKKKEKVLIQNFRHELVEKIENLTNIPDDPPKLVETLALKFHTLVTLLFLDQTKCPLHASGKFVPNIVDYLIAHPSNPAADAHLPLKEILVECQKLIIELYGNQHVGGETNSNSGENGEDLGKSAKQMLLAEKLDALQGICLMGGNKSSVNDIISHAD